MYSSYRRAFTLIELVVVIIIIGVLAGIAAFAYTQVRANANERSQIQTIENFAKSYNGALASGLTPAAAYTSATGELGSNVTTTTRLKQYRNLATGGTTSALSGSISAPDTTWSGESGWHRYNRGTYSPGVMDGPLRYLLPLNELTPNTPYVVSLDVGNPNAFPITVSLDWNDGAATLYDIGAGEKQRIVHTGTRSGYNSTFRFADFSLHNQNTNILIKNPAVEVAPGTSEFYNGATTNTSEWTYTWEGTANTSISVKQHTSNPGAVQFNFTGQNYCYALNEPGQYAGAKQAPTSTLTSGTYRKGNC